MDRLLFKTLAYGKYIETHHGETIDQKVLTEFVQGALFAFDFLTKQKVEAKADKPLIAQVSPINDLPQLGKV